jgi:hypothetical protein
LDFIHGRLRNPTDSGVRGNGASVILEYPYNEDRRYPKAQIYETSQAEGKAIQKTDRRIARGDREQ